MSSSLTLHDFEVVARRLPVPAFDVSDLRHFGSKASQSLDEFIRHGASEAVRLPEWAVDVIAICPTGPQPKTRTWSPSSISAKPAPNQPVGRMSLNMIA